MSVARLSSLPRQSVATIAARRSYNSLSLNVRVPTAPALTSQQTFASFTASTATALSSVPASISAALGQIGVGSSTFWKELLPAIVWASVPKHRTSHSKKRMRQANKGLAEQKNIVNCPGCGQAKMMHHLCTHCYRDMKGRGPKPAGPTITEA